MAIHLLFVIPAKAGIPFLSRSRVKPGMTKQTGSPCSKRSLTMTDTISQAAPLESKIPMSPTLLAGPEIPSASGITKRLVIFLHGLGSNGDDLISLAELMDVPDTHFISPNAPFAFDMAPFGYQWFSLTSMQFDAMVAGAKTAEPILNHFIDHQRARFKLANADIALVGFSQGTMMALYTGLRRATPLAGVVGFSGALLAADAAAEITAKPPLCLIHGTMDMVVPFTAMGAAEAGLRAQDVSVESHARPGLGHGIDERGIELATVFLRKQFQI